MNDIKHISIDSIYISENRHWNVYEKDVEKLKSSIKEEGLITPIAVQERNGQYKLIAGEHRLTACKQLGWSEIPAHIIAREYEEDEIEDLRLEILEADENLKRKVPDFIAESFILNRRKQAYDKLMQKKFGFIGDVGKFLKSENGKLNMKNLEQYDKSSQLPEVLTVNTSGDIKTFQQDAAEKTGKSISDINKKIRLANLLDEENKNLIKENDINRCTIDTILVGCNENNQDAFNEHLEIIDTLQLPTGVNKNKFYNEVVKDIKTTLPEKFQKENPMEFASIVRDRIDDYVSLEVKKHTTNIKILKEQDFKAINKILASMDNANNVTILVDGEIIYEF